PGVSTLGGTQTIVPLDAMELMQVKTTDTTPQNARSPGAQVIVITKAGTDRFSGSGFLDWRPETLGATDWFARSENEDTGEYYSRPPANSQSSGLSVGGPLVRQQLYFFGAWERQHVDRPLSAILQLPSIDARRSLNATAASLLNLLPVPNGPEDASGD